VFAFWAGVYGGWRAALASLATFAVIAGILVFMVEFVPGVNPGFVLVPVVVVGIVLLRRYDVRRRPADPDDGRPPV
jgi:hypothetical protein